MPKDSALQNATAVPCGLISSALSGELMVTFTFSSSSSFFFLAGFTRVKLLTIIYFGQAFDKDNIFTGDIEGLYEMTFLLT